MAQYYLHGPQLKGDNRRSEREELSVQHGKQNTRVGQHRKAREALERWLNG